MLCWAVSYTLQVCIIGTFIFQRFYFLVLCFGLFFSLLFLVTALRNTLLELFICLYSLHSVIPVLPWLCAGLQPGTLVEQESGLAIVFGAHQLCIEEQLQGWVATWNWFVCGFKYRRDQKSRRATGFLHLVQLLGKAREDRGGKK